MSEFSVLIAFYYKDNPELLKRALSSIYNNTVLPKEVILIQDGPVSHELLCIVSFFKKYTGFQLIQLELNSGLSFALNEGLKYISTPFVFRADADDFNLPHRFETQLKYLEDGYDLVGSNILEVDLDGSPIAIRSVPLYFPDIKSFAAYRNPFNHMSVAFRLSSVINLGGYPSIYLKEDYALWALLIANGCNVVNIDDVLVNATTGINMYKRRGGFKYLVSEFNINFLLFKLKLQPLYLTLPILAFRIFIFLLPGFIKGLIYKVFLRSKVYYE